jgi:hypothetical protein
VRVLGHTPALIRVEVDVVDVEGRSNKGLGVGVCDLGTSGIQGRHCEKALINCADVKVNLYLVVLKSNQWKSKTRVAAEPEEKRNVEGGLRESIARSADLARSSAVARAIHWGEVRVSQEGKLGGLANHLVVALLLVLVKGKLVPDLHPVTVLLVNALTTNLDLNVINELMAREIEPARIHAATSIL